MTPSHKRLLITTLTALLTSTLSVPTPAHADQIRDLQWWLAPLRIEEAHSVTRGQGVVVGLIDSPVDESRPEIRGRILPGKGFQGADPANGWSSEAAAGHGTRMAGIIAGQSPKKDGFLGVAPDAKVLPFAAANASTDAVAEGVRWLTDQGAKVINLSQGTLDPAGPREVSALQYALSRDVVVVASAGNRDGGDAVGNPANIPGVVAVSGVDPSGDFSNGSSFGSEVVLAAPSEKIIAPTPVKTIESGYGMSTGTSPAAAIVSGVAALIRAKYPKMSAANVIERMIRTARDNGDPGRDPYFGFGTIRPYQALTEDVPEVKDSSLGTPTTQTTTPGQPATAAGPPPRPTKILGLAPSRWAVIAIAALALIFLIFLIVLISKRRQPVTPLGFHQPLPNAQNPPGWPPPQGPTQQWPPPQGPVQQLPPPPAPAQQLPPPQWQTPQGSYPQWPSPQTGPPPGGPPEPRRN